MMTVTAMHVGQVPYLVEEASYDDYLSQRGELPGIWAGRGTTHLKLTGAVEGPALTNLLTGMSPDGSVPLVQLSAIRKDQERAAGTMLTLSDPKSVSALYALGDPWVSRGTEESHHAAVTKFVAHLEENHAYTRRGSGGTRWERCSIATAIHTHYTNRNGDFQVHSHLSIPNISVRSDGTTGTLVNKPFFDHQMELGRVYRGYLALELINRLGVKIEPDGESFRVVGVPKVVEQEFSTRRPEILAEMDRRGSSGREASDDANKATRKPKQYVSRAELDNDWRSRAAKHGFGETEIRAIVKPHPYRETQPQTPVRSQVAAAPHTNVNTASPKTNDDKAAPNRAVAKQPGQKVESTAPLEKPLPPRASEESANVLQFREFTRTFGKGGKAAEKLPPVSKEPPVTPKIDEASFNPGDRMAMKRLIMASFDAKVPKDSVFRLIDHLMDKVVDSNHNQQRNQRELGTAEERSARLESIVSTAMSAAKDQRHAIAADKVDSQFSRLGGQAEPFRQAAIDLISHRGAAAVIQTGAGVEGETFLRTIRGIYENAGFKVMGVTPSGIGAATMETATDIKTHTVSQFLYHVSPGWGQTLKHHTSQLWGAFKNHPTRAFDRWHLDSKTLVVVSDTQSMDSNQVHWLQLAATQANAKILFVGDPQQYKFREPGNTFESLSDKLAVVKLPDSPRPVEHWAQEAIKQSTRGDVTGALSQFAMANRLVLREDYNQAAASLIRTWGQQNKTDRKESMIIAPDSAQAKVLNRAAQHLRQQNGEVGKLLRQRMNGNWVYRNDRVQFQGNSKTIGYRSGDLGSVERIGLEGVTIRLDRDRSILGFKVSQKVFVPHKRYGDVTLGYAVDAFRAQSITAKNVFALTDGNATDAHTLRSQISRATNETRIFTARRCVEEEVEQLHDLTRFDIMEKMRNSPLVLQKNLSPLANWYDKRFGPHLDDTPRPKVQAVETAGQPQAETQNPAEDKTREKVEQPEAQRMSV